MVFSFRVFGKAISIDVQLSRRVYVLENSPRKIGTMNR